MGWGYEVSAEADITEFLLYYADTPDPAAWTIVQMDLIEPALREVTVSIAGTEDICFMMRAANGAILSGDSNSACWSVPPPPPPDPPAPSNLVIQ